MIVKIIDKNIVISAEEFFRELVNTNDFALFVQKLQSFVISRTWESENFEVFVEILNKCETDINNVSSDIRKIHNFNEREFKEVKCKLNEIAETQIYMNNETSGMKLEFEKKYNKQNNKINIYFIICILLIIALFLLSK